MQNIIIDFHAHAFPDAVAVKAIPSIEKQGGIKAFADGTLDSLLSTMDQTGIQISVLASIATRPAQFASILAWSTEIRSNRIIPFPSVHPDSPNILSELQIIKDKGFKGIKMHPYYQNFCIDDPRMYPIYEKISSLDLILLCHAGFDIAFPKNRIADPKKIVTVFEKFPALKIVAGHLGAWQDWEEVEKHILGKPIYLDTSFAVNPLWNPRAKKILESHPKEYLLFGTDTPWDNPFECIKLIQSLHLPEDRLHALFYKNAKSLLTI